MYTLEREREKTLPNIYTMYANASNYALSTLTLVCTWYEKSTPGL